MIEKHTFRVTVLIDSENPGVEVVSEASLGDIEWLINEGPGIGMLSHESAEEVPPDALEAELLAIGNDGTFFAPVDGGDDEEEAA